MIVVALIGILSAIAIPGYRLYQARSRRTEAYMNLAAIIQTEDSYYAEHQAYVGIAASVPGFPPVGTQKRPWTAADENVFAPIGWSPEGGVFYDYFINTTAGCTCPPGTCVTATAYGDVDADGTIAVVIYARGTAASACPDGLLGASPIPTMYNTLATYDQVQPLGVSGQF
jgi:type II secretory pathway pseudopilin PulG